MMRMVMISPICTVCSRLVLRPSILLPFTDIVVFSLLLSSDIPYSHSVDISFSTVAHRWVIAFCFLYIFVFSLFFLSLDILYSHFVDFRFSTVAHRWFIADFFPSHSFGHFDFFSFFFKTFLQVKETPLSPQCTAQRVTTSKIPLYCSPGLLNARRLVSMLQKRSSACCAQQHTQTVLSVTSLSA